MYEHLIPLLTPHSNPARSRMQTQGTQRVSILHVLRTSILENGIFRGLFTGISASIMRQMSYSLVRLGSYEAMKQKLSRKGRASTVKLLSAAALAGGLGGVAGNPAGTCTYVSS
jgi:dicarboxylate transporter 10